jgi:triacylglycerol lipase
MSTFVELTPDQYSPAAFAKFDPAATDFKIDNARAMMWMSQLAYEPGQPRTIEAVGKLWNLISVTPFTRHKISLAASFETCGIMGERQHAVILAFAGTDPAVWETLATDFNIRPTGDKNTHSGFQAALDAVQPEIAQAIERSRQSGKPLFIAGHSLGGALAALAAQFADIEGARPRAVYVFGMPRTGGEKFQTDYDASLGPVTFRLVHGLDIVARVPMSEIGFRHVGRAVQCGSGKKFDPAARLSEIGSDSPEFSAGLAQSIVGGVEGILSGHIFSPPGPGTFGPLFKYLPRPIRDHLQDCYYTALA